MYRRMGPKELEKVIERVKMDKERLFGVYLNDELQAVSTGRRGAVEWAENKYGSKSDGICVNGVEIREFAEGEGEVARHSLDRP